jgi:hypothetical protein
MNTRRVTIYTGRVFQVPERIQRIDTDSTHGWQLRYGDEPTKFFSDGSADGRGAQASLERATDALHKRIRRLPAPTGLRTERASWKTSKLPVGISGPQERLREGRTVPYYAFLVSVPIAGRGSTTRSVYIGTKNTINRKRIKEALEKAKQIREQAVEAFARDKTRELRNAVRQARAR